MKTEAHTGVGSHDLLADYPANWPEIAKRIKDNAGWHCERCHHVNDLAPGSDHENAVGPGFAP